MHGGKICPIINLNNVRIPIIHFGLRSAVNCVANLLLLSKCVENVIKTDNPNLFNDTHYSVAVANAFP